MKNLVLVAVVLPGVTAVACVGAPEGADEDALQEDVAEHADALVDEVMLKRGYTQTDPACVTPPVSDGADAMIATVTALGGSVQSDTQSCIMANKEVFTGVSVMSPLYIPLPGQPAPPPTYVDHYGGAGRTMAEAGVCALREAFVKSIQLPAPVGGFWVPMSTGNGSSASMSIGGTHWDPATKTIEGYRSLKFTLPLIGSITTRPQWFSATVASSSPAFYPSADTTPNAGSKLISKAYSLWIKAENSDRKIAVNLPSLSVLTPYGQISASPSFEYETRSQVIVTPTMNASNAVQSDVTLPFGSVFDTGQFTDLYGRDRGGNFVEVGGNAQGARGWMSSIGLGGRGRNAPWNGAGIRPDTALATPRYNGVVSSSFFQDEAAPNAHGKADVAITFDAAKILPPFLTVTPFNTTFALTVTPSISADFWSQLFLNSAEGYSVNTDVSYYEDRAGSLLLRAGLAGKSNITVTADLTFTVFLDLYFGFGHLHEKIIDLTQPLPTLYNDNPTPKYVETGAARGNVTWEKNNTMQHTVLDPAYFDEAKVTTLGGNGAPLASPSAWRDACLAVPEATKALPTGTYQAGTVQDVVDKMVLPCNICVNVVAGTRKVTDPQTGQSQSTYVPGSSTKVLPGSYGAFPVWTCNAENNGCYDYCKVVVQADGSRTSEVIDDQVSSECGPVIQ